jgi:hypothetical protein
VSPSKKHNDFVHDKAMKVMPVGDFFPAFTAKICASAL